ncbi:MAG: PSD1 and planctomycete cytochrome C domain-containing protein [Verrucomicrobiota bacterium]
MSPITPKFTISGIALAGALFLAGCGKETTQPQTVSVPEVIEFNEHIRPILTKNCAACHGGVKKSGGLSFVFEEEAIAVGQSGSQSIIPGDPDASYLIEKVTSTDPNFRMPPPDHGPALKEKEIALLKEWIKQGASWEEHWAFSPVAVAEVPPVQSDWITNEIDAFILDRLNQEALSPSPEAQKGALLRRLSIDLTGIPPTEEELQSFIADDSPDAYERQVDRLLASPRYGERWATLWLDLARYADSKGAGQDGPRNIYKFRNWVIRAFNEDMPFDEFTIKQIAGDLLPNPTFDDYLATAFHRNTQNEDEGGTDDEEFRVLAVMDRVNTTWQVWHGTTFSCVQCHSHPYDPFRHEEYYEFSAFFNNTQDADTYEEFPYIEFPKDEAKQLELKDLIGQRYQAIEANWERSHELAESTDWHWLTDMSVTTSKDEQLRYKVIEREGREEFVFEGTPAWNKMTILTDAPALEKPVQALRMDVLPLDLDKAPFQPSAGFFLKRLKIVHISGEDQTETPIAFDRVYRDEPHSFYWGDPKKGESGFSATTRIFHRRYAVFRFKEPFEVEDGDQLKFIIEHGATGGGKIMILRRGSLAITDNETWRSLEDEETWVANKHVDWKTYDQLKKLPNVRIPIMRERPEHLARGNKIFVRGNWTTLGDEVAADTPASLHPMPDTDEPARLRMAKWLADENNPLTARVLVSRFWEQLFGVGIVETLEDFGSIGETPSHPEMLDYLAYQFMHEYEWSMKSLLRDMVMSSAYRQTSVSSPELQELDPKNRLLARGPRSRLTGEMVRDQVMAVAGILNEDMFGEPVKPPLPEGGWTPSHTGAGDWVADKDDRIFRRSIYIHWQRSSVYPMLAAFDAPSRELCTDRRITSNTPVQPLFTLNDPALFMATQAFGQKMKNHSEDLSRNIAYGYQVATAQEIAPAVLEELVELHGSIVELYPDEEPLLQEEYENHIERQLNQEREQLKKERNRLIWQAKNKKQDPPEDLPDPDSVSRDPNDQFSYSAELAAYDAVASVLLNLDEVLTK